MGNPVLPALPTEFVLPASPTIDLRLMDCMELMAQYPDKHFDLAIVDPPYGIDAIKKVYKNRGGYIGKSTGLRSGCTAKKSTHIQKTWDEKPYTIEQYQELVRVSKNRIVFGCNYYEKYFEGGGRIVWDKLNFANDFSDGEIAYYSGHNKVDIVYFLWNGLMKGDTGSRDPRKALKQMGGDSKDRQKRIHPTEKPVGLYQWLLKKYAKKGYKILDTHLGSGNIALACHDYGFDLVGCEIDADYYADMMKRFEQHKLQACLPF
jgi:site-specific DNA-methyltransferase (adenine-specific)